MRNVITSIHIIKRRRNIPMLQLTSAVFLRYGTTQRYDNVMSTLRLRGKFAFRKIMDCNVTVMSPRRYISMKQKLVSAMFDKD